MPGGVYLVPGGVLSPGGCLVWGGVWSGVWSRGDLALRGIWSGGSGLGGVTPQIFWGDFFFCFFF